MDIYQLQNPKEFIQSYGKPDGTTIQDLLAAYAKHVATKFAAECVNEAHENIMEVSNALHKAIEDEYNTVNNLKPQQL